jgi:hypothetical protein
MSSKSNTLTPVNVDGSPNGWVATGKNNASNTIVLVDDGGNPVILGGDSGGDYVTNSEFEEFKKNNLEKGYSAYKSVVQTITNSSSSSALFTVNANFNLTIAGTSAFKLPSSPDYQPYKLSLRPLFTFEGNPTANGTVSISLIDAVTNSVFSSKTFLARNQTLTKDEYSFNLRTINETDFKIVNGFKIRITNNSGVTLTTQNFDMIIERG